MSTEHSAVAKKHFGKVIMGKPLLGKG